MDTVRRSDLFWSVVLYLPDPADEDALWYYDGEPNYGDSDPDTLQFERLFVSKRREEVVNTALHSENNDLQGFIDNQEFVWLEPMQQGGVSAVLYLGGNQQADFRDYSFSE